MVSSGTFFQLFTKGGSILSTPRKAHISTSPSLAAAMPSSKQSNWLMVLISPRDCHQVLMALRCSSWALRRKPALKLNRGCFLNLKAQANCTISKRSSLHWSRVSRPSLLLHIASAVAEISSNLSQRDGKCRSRVPQAWHFSLRSAIALRHMLWRRVAVLKNDSMMPSTKI